MDSQNIIELILAESYRKGLVFLAAKKIKVITHNLLPEASKGIFIIAFLM